MNISDPIYGNIVVSSLARSLIDTPIFQRLRSIKQLGVVYYVFPSAEHSRFTHSLGVYHVTGLLLDSLIKRYPNDTFTALDKTFTLSEFKEYICIAGLLHDLGHGPFSHLYDDFSNTNHEERSLILAQTLLKNKVDAYWIKFVLNCIYPKLEIENLIFTFIHNRQNGIDTDKIDYFLRDSFFLGAKRGIDLFRIINNWMIVNDRIIFPEKLKITLYEFFRTRYDLFRNYYMHKTVKKVEILITEMLKTITLPENIEEFLLLTDEIVIDRARNTEAYSRLMIRDLPKSCSKSEAKYTCLITCSPFSVSNALERTVLMDRNGRLLSLKEAYEKEEEILYFK